MRFMPYYATAAIAFKWVRSNFIMYLYQSLADVVLATILYFLWTSAFVETDQFGGLSQGQLLNYLFISQVLRIVMGYMGMEAQLSQWVRTGDILRELTLPINPVLKDFAHNSGWLLALGILNGFPVVVLGALVSGLRRPPVETVMPFVISVLMALVLSFSLSYLVGSLAFWTEGSLWGIISAKRVVVALASGGLIPLDVMPGWLAQGLKMAPFSGMVYIPATIWMGKVKGLDLIYALGFQSCWALILAYCAYRFFWFSARKLIVVGG